MASNLENALKLLGLDNADDPALLWENYLERLGALQNQLVRATTESQQRDVQARLANLVGAYEVLRNLSSAPSTAARSVDREARTLFRIDGNNAVSPSPAPAPARVRVITPGVVLQGRYEIESVLGDGGMGRVYAARDRLKEEEVAIKVLRSELLSSAAARGRFLAEAKVSCRLAHPNIIRVFDVGIVDGHYFFTMERLHGQSLRQRMQLQLARGEPFPIEEAMSIAEQLLDALRHAHQYIVHRDLKPENVWLEEGCSLKLMDFGIARAFVQSPITRTGMNLGTAYYMAPEQHTGAKNVDWRADQYAFGVLMYELLTGRIPMGALQPLEHVRKDVPKEFARAIMRAMSPRPDARFSSMRELQNIVAARKSDEGPLTAFSSLGRSVALGTIGGAIFASLDSLSMSRIDELAYPSGIAAGIGTALIIEFCEAFFRSRARAQVLTASAAMILWIFTVLFVAQLARFSDGLIVMLCGAMGASATDYVTRQWRVAGGRYRVQAATAGALFGSVVGVMLLMGSDFATERNYWLSALSGLLPGMIISMASLRRRLWNTGINLRSSRARGGAFNLARR